VRGGVWARAGFGTGAKDEDGSAGVSNREVRG